MSPQEAAWRLRCVLRNAVDRPLASRRRRMRPLRSLVDAGPAEAWGFSVSDLTPGEWSQPAATARQRQWLERLCQRADRIATGHLSLFNQEDRPCGEPIDWNRDHEAGIAAPMGFSPSLDYRDYRVTGDAKYVWEPNRHQHLVVLGRAYRASGQIRYAQAPLEQWSSWQDQCRYGLGMNWRSPLELAIRLINWVWAFDLIRPAGLVGEAVATRLFNSVDLHLWEIARKYSRGSSANNHIIGEAAGVFIAASYFRQIKRAARCRRDSYGILCDQAEKQTFPDGANREQATGYHLFVLQFLLLAGLVGRWSDCEFPAEYWSSLQRQFGFLAALQEGGAHLPMIGDADDGYVLDLGAHGADLPGWLAAGAVVFDRGDLKALAGGYGETARWLLGRSGNDRFEAIASPTQVPPVACHAFADGGLYLLQCGHPDSDDRISVTFDCGPLGLGAIAAHGHADALAITLRAFGVDVLVDPGTYDYFRYPAWRDYFRSTRAHNTLVIDGQDQSVMQGMFLWGRRARARCLAWQPHANGATVVGEHDGYGRLSDPVTHRRRVQLDAISRQVTIDDEILAAGRHSVEVRFHLAEQCEIGPMGTNLFRIETGRGPVTLEADPRLGIRAERGGVEPIGGWVSRGYHRKTPAITLTGRCLSEGSIRLQCRLTIGTAVRQSASDARGSREDHEVSTGKALPRMDTRTTERSADRGG